MTDNVIPIPVVEHKPCWHERLRNSKRHGPYMTNYTFTTDMMKRIPKGVEKVEMCCWCGVVHGEVEHP